MIRKVIIYGLSLLIWVNCSPWPVSADSEPPAEGGRLPEFTLPVPEDPAHRDYLGFTNQETFAIQDIKADVVIIEIFSMY